ncbi:hypothetical protein AAC387_Pa08g1379 [Persea americana]
MRLGVSEPNGKEAEKIQLAALVHGMLTQVSPQLDPPSQKSHYRLQAHGTVRIEVEPAFFLFCELQYWVWE